MITKIFKWDIFIAIILLFFFVGTAWAVDNDVPLFLLTPDDLTYDAGLAIEDAQYSLTKNVTERFEILNLSVDRSLKLLGNARDPKDFKLLLEKYQQGETRLLNFWDNLNVRDAELVAGLMLEAINNRAQILQDILENGNPPKRTQDDLKQVIENIISAKEKHAEALTRAILAHQQSLKRQEEARSQAGSSTPGLAGSSPDIFSSGPGSPGSAPGGFTSGRGIPGFIPPGFGGTPPGQDKDNSPTAEFCPVCGKLIHPQNHCICDEDEDNSPTAEFCPVCGKLIHPQNHCICDEDEDNSPTAEFCPVCDKLIHPQDHCICGTDNESQEEDDEDENNGNNSNSGNNGNNGGPPSEFPGQGMDQGNAEPGPFTNGDSGSDSPPGEDENDD